MREFEPFPADKCAVTDGGVLSNDTATADSATTIPATALSSRKQVQGPMLVLATLVATMAAGAVGRDSDGATPMAEPAPVRPIAVAIAAEPEEIDPTSTIGHDYVEMAVVSENSEPLDSVPSLPRKNPAAQRLVAVSRSAIADRYEGFSPEFVLAVAELTSAGGDQPPEFKSIATTTDPAFASMINNFEGIKSRQIFMKRGVWSDGIEVTQLAADAAIEITSLPSGKRFGADDLVRTVARLATAGNSKTGEVNAESEPEIRIASVAPEFLADLTPSAVQANAATESRPPMLRPGLAVPAEAREAPGQIVMHAPVSDDANAMIQPSIRTGIVREPTPNGPPNDQSVIVPMPDWPYDLRVFVPNTVSEEIAGSIVDQMIGSGFVPVKESRVGFRISASHVRFYHQADRNGAERLAATFGGEARDFSSTATKPDPGTLEVWLAGQGKSERRVATTRKSKKVSRRPAKTLRELKLNSQEDIKRTIQLIRKAPRSLMRRINGKPAK